MGNDEVLVTFDQWKETFDTVQQTRHLKRFDKGATLERVLAWVESIDPKSDLSDVTFVRDHGKE